MRRFCAIIVIRFGTYSILLMKINRHGTHVLHTVYNLAAAAAVVAAQNHLTLTIMNGLKQKKSLQRIEQHELRCVVNID